MAGPNDPVTPVGSSPLGEPGRKRPVWLLPVVLLVILVVLLLLLSQCLGGDDDGEDDGSASSTASTTSATSSDPASSASAAASASETGEDAGAGDAEAGTASATVVVGDVPLLPLGAAAEVGADGSLAAYTGQPVEGRAVAVQSVPADEGFWVGASIQDRVWVQLTGGGESPFVVKQGDEVSFSGTVVANGAGFADAAGVTDAEGRTQLDAQGQHLETARTGLELSK